MLAPPLLFASCRVQFDRRELGVELVKDVDVMPIDPLDSLPPSLLSASGHLLLNGRRATNGVPQVAACIRLWSKSTSASTSHTCSFSLAALPHVLCASSRHSTHEYAVG